MDGLCLAYIVDRAIFRPALGFQPPNAIAVFGETRKVERAVRRGTGSPLVVELALASSLFAAGIHRRQHIPARQRFTPGHLPCLRYAISVQVVPCVIVAGAAALARMPFEKLRPDITVEMLSDVAVPNRKSRSVVRNHGMESSNRSARNEHVAFLPHPYRTVAPPGHDVRFAAALDHFHANAHATCAIRRKRLIAVRTADFGRRHVPGAGFPIVREFAPHCMNESRLVGIDPEGRHAAVRRRAYPMANELPVFRAPCADAFRQHVGFRDIQCSFIRDGKPVGKKHAVLFEGSDPRSAAKLAYRAKELSIRGKLLYAHLAGPVGNVKVAFGIHRHRNRCGQIPFQHSAHPAFRTDFNYASAAYGQEGAVGDAAEPRRCVHRNIVQLPKRCRIVEFNPVFIEFRYGENSFERREPNRIVGFADILVEIARLSDVSFRRKRLG